MLSRPLCRRLVPIVLGMWLVAFMVSVAHACAIVGHHQTIAPVTMSHGSASGDGEPSECERFCSVDTPLATKSESASDTATSPAAFLVASTASVRVPVLDHRSPSASFARTRGTALPVLRQTLRLAL